MARRLIVAAAIAMFGCAPGMIYTHITQPLTTHFNDTPMGDRFVAEGDVKELRYGMFLRTLWDENSIGSIAKDAGFEEIYYADLETFSVLGIWTQYRVHVYGTKTGNGDATP